MAGGVPVDRLPRRARPGGDRRGRRRDRARPAARPRGARRRAARAAGRRGAATRARRRGARDGRGRVHVAALRRRDGGRLRGRRCDEARPVRHQPRAAVPGRRVRGAARARGRGVRADRRRRAPRRRRRRRPTRCRSRSSARPSAASRGSPPRAASAPSSPGSPGASRCPPPTPAPARRASRSCCGRRSGRTRAPRPTRSPTCRCATCTATPTRSSPTARTSPPTCAPRARTRSSRRPRASTTRSGRRPPTPERRAPFQALFAGREAPEKGLGVLRDAWRQAALPDAELVGRREAETPERLRNFYAGSDVLVVPSIPTRDFLEPWGLVVNEAFDQGVPVIATDAVGAAAGGLVQHDRTGLVVPAGDARALAAALRRLHGDRDLRERLGNAAREAVRGYSHDAWAGGVERRPAGGRNLENPLLAWIRCFVQPWSWGACCSGWSPPRRPPRPRRRRSSATAPTTVSCRATTRPPSCARRARTSRPIPTSTPTAATCSRAPRRPASPTPTAAAAAAGGRRSGGSRSNRERDNGPPADPHTPEGRQIVGEAAAKPPPGPVTISGRPVIPGTAGLAADSVRNEIPPSLIMPRAARLPERWPPSPRSLRRHVLARAPALTSRRAAAPHPDRHDPVGGTGRLAELRLGVALVIVLATFVARGGVRLEPTTNVEIGLMLLGGASWSRAACLSAPREPPVRRLGRARVRAAGRYTALSILWSLAPADSWSEANRMFAYLAVVRRRRRARAPVPRALGGAALRRAGRARDRLRVGAADQGLPGGAGRRRARSPACARRSSTGTASG